jgi:hypothetical protein
MDINVCTIIIKFKDPGPNAQKFIDGTELIKQIIGSSKIMILQDIVLNRQLNPAEPDLFAYKENDLLFIEVKRDNDKLRTNQKIGIDLIGELLKINAQVAHYIGK